MGNKEIQEQRVKGYFIQATKEILKGEGLKGANVRNIAQKAGYSYATLYNYFNDAKDLVFVCVQDFQDECAAFVKNKSKKSKPGIERLQAIVKNYIAFFVQYPGIFELFFLEKTGDINGKKPVGEMVYSFLGRLCQDDWNAAVSTGEIQVEQVENIKNSINYNVTGMLLFYLNRVCPANYTEFMNHVEAQLHHLLNLKNISVNATENKASVQSTTVNNSLLTVKIGN